MSEFAKVSTRFEWFDAAGKLLRTDEVKGDGSAFILDMKAGKTTVLPIGLEAPKGAALVATRLVGTIKEAQ